MAAGAPHAGESSRAAIERDASDLRRSLRLNLLGYVVKLAHPFLLIVVIARYGAGAYGVFALVQAVLVVLLRLALLGLDKGLLWWIPRQVQADERLGLRAVLIIATLTSALLAAATALILAPLIAGWAGRPDITDSLRWMAVGLVPMALLEVLCQASVGKRHLEAHVIAKEGVVAMTMVVAALLLHALGLVATGLALAFLISYVAGLLAVLWVFRRAFAGSAWGRRTWRLPAELWRYSWPMWLSELANALFVRLDVFILAALTDEVAVGIFAGAAQYAQNVTAIRVSFDPMVTAMVSQIGHANDRDRMRRGFAHAWLLVATLQIP
ncbi:MAG TPA: oligosaccharide flippase family protein, partial [Nannocystis sp.]